MSKVRPQPYKMELEPGEYAWCACGESENQPFCDGSHDRKRTGKQPIVVRIEQAGRVAWCGCRCSGRVPFCDGTHRSLPGYVQPKRGQGPFSAAEKGP